jgi:hypothetical protein
MPKKRMPVAERQQETPGRRSRPLRRVPGDNWPDTSLVAGPGNGADVGR